MAVVAAGSPAAIPDLRQRVLSLLARPAVEPEAPQLQQPTHEEEGADVLSQQRWLVRAEPTDAGLVPTLCVRQKKLLGRRLPVVIVLHGTGGSKDEMLPHLRRYANMGFLACAIDSRYHGERGDPQQYTQALVAAWHANKKGGEPSTQQRPFMYDTAWDLTKIMDWLCTRTDVDPLRIGITGVSLGGMHSWLAAAADPRIAAVAPLIGVQGYRFALDHEMYTGRVGSIQPVFEAIAASMGTSIDAKLVEAVWEHLCPGLVHGDMAMDAPSSLRLIAPRPMLIMNGEDDPR